ncbi:methyltransferase domain-containing protein [Microbacterium protaetiae]|uniref:Methyltransferase domain-containing protein n=1 Tax=Microbacterium protaetiae TaxID=2509458 RepID=A0A4P6EFJ1_9MICO|nr:class I SAM-dependent methyltransferase [Microbacterium protaetiae]QAY61150.1 methyltransferase domain-containing protein [Microbacterium protaetiae]
MSETRRLARSFEQTGAAYDRYRPSFPPAAVDVLVPDHVRAILDLGAGTGKLTELVHNRADHVFAVDPSAQMLAVLRDKLPAVDARDGTAESIPLPDASVDTVVVAQAFHWFDRDAAVTEIRRVLRRDGTLGLVWNGSHPDCAWDLACAAVAHPRPVEDETAEHETTQDEDDVPGFRLRRVERIEWIERLARADYIRRWHTVSTFLAADEPTHARMTGEINAILDEHPATAGRMTLDLRQRTVVYVYDALPV